MKASVKKILGVAVALVTAVTLHVMVGHRFCGEQLNGFEHLPCKKHESKTRLSPISMWLNAPQKPIYCSHF